MKGQKSKYRFNLIDAILIVLIIAVLCVIYYFVSGNNGIFSKGNDKNTHTMRYVIELKTVDKDFVDNLEDSVNKELIETIRNGIIGKVVKVDVTPAWTVTTDVETGEMKKNFYPAINVSSSLDEPDANKDEAVTDEETIQDKIGETVTDEEQEPEAPVYDYYNVRLTIEADMQYTGNSYSVGGYDIVVGHPVYFRLPSYIGSGYCIFLEEVE